jgi:hypothetical protein
MLIIAISLKMSSQKWDYQQAGSMFYVKRAAGSFHPHPGPNVVDLRADDVIASR